MPITYIVSTVVDSIGCVLFSCLLSFVSFDYTYFVGCWPCFSCNNTFMDILSVGALSGRSSDTGTNLEAPKVAAFWVEVLVDCEGIEPYKHACCPLG